MSYQLKYLSFKGVDFVLFSSFLTMIPDPAFSAIFIFMLALVGVFYPYNRGSLFTALVIIYALTSGIAGYYAASFYYMVEGKNWVRYITWIKQILDYKSELCCLILFRQKYYQRTVKAHSAIE